MNSSRNSECSMPETGPRAPARTLVAVRAIVPVTQMPPNSAEPILAKPCATSSQLERWRRPVMPSATTADSSDSMAPSSANAMASGNTACIFASENGGSAGSGNSRGCRRSGCRWSRPAARGPRSRTPRPRPRSACPASAAAAPEHDDQRDLTAAIATAATLRSASRARARRASGSARRAPCPRA